MVASPFGKDPLAKALTMLPASADKLALLLVSIRWRTVGQPDAPLARKATP